MYQNFIKEAALFLIGTNQLSLSNLHWGNETLDSGWFLLGKKAT